MGMRGTSSDGQRPAPQMLHPPPSSPQQRPRTRLLQRRGSLLLQAQQALATRHQELDGVRGHAKLAGQRGSEVGAGGPGAAAAAAVLCRQLQAPLILAKLDCEFHGRASRGRGAEGAEFLGGSACGRARNG